MSEKDFKQSAAERQGITCVYFPPKKRGGKPILQTLEPVKVDAFHVEKGRWTDGGSVPPAFHWVAHPLGYLFRAYLVHDVSLFDGYGWKDSNARFDLAMRSLGAPYWQRTLILSAVKSNALWQKTKHRFGGKGRYV